MILFPMFVCLLVVAMWCLIIFFYGTFTLILWVSLLVHGGYLFVSFFAYLFTLLKGDGWELILLTLWYYKGRMMVGSRPMPRSWCVYFSVRLFEYSRPKFVIWLRGGILDYKHREFDKSMNIFPILYQHLIPLRSFSLLLLSHAMQYFVFLVIVYVYMGVCIDMCMCNMKSIFFGCVCAIKNERKRICRKWL
jgi:hypothetical protein